MSTPQGDDALVPRRVAIGSIELHCVERGRGDPVVLLHGGTGDYRAWRAHLGVFATRYRTVAYSRRHSFPNCNGDPAADYSALADADDLARLLDQLGIDAAHLIGVSYGALVPLNFAIRAPDRVRSLLLFEPPLPAWIAGTDRGRAACDDFHRRVWDPAAQAFRAGRISEAMALLVDGFAGQPAFRALSPVEVHALLQNAGAMRALTLSTDPFPEVPRARVRKLVMPALIGRGDQTTTIHRLAVEALGSEMPAAVHVVIDDAGHRAPFERPLAFANVAMKWLMALPSDAERRFVHAPGRDGTGAIE